MCSSRQTSHTLLQRAMADDQEAWNELFTHYRNFIYHFLHQMQVRPSDADDLAQEVMIILTKKLHTYDRTKGLFRTWFRRVILNHCLMFFRKEGTRQKYSDQYERDRAIGMAEPSTELEEKFDNEWQMHTLQIAMDQIKDRFSPNAEKIIWLELKGYSVIEIARELDMSEQSVYKMRTRIRRSLFIQTKQVIMDLEDLR